VNFICFATEAKSVALVGDFNGWNPDALAMNRQPDGAWTAQVEMGHGHHQYLFLVDGKPTLDPKAQGIARNEKKTRECLLSRFNPKPEIENG